MNDLRWSSMAKPMLLLSYSGSLISCLTTTFCATVGETIQRHMNQKFREQKRNAAVAELIPSELLSRIKRWAKDNNCLPTDAIARLIGLGLHASKAEKAAPRKAKRLAEGVAITV